MSLREHINYTNHTMYSIMFISLALWSLVNASPLAQRVRLRRQLDVTVSAEHDDKEEETKVILEAIANLWRSTDGNTQIDGSAKVVHHSNALQDGPNDFRLGVRIVFQ